MSDALSGLLGATKSGMFQTFALWMLTRLAISILKRFVKICNVCHCLLEDFARNQNNIHGIVRRPSCNRCRTDIDKRAPKSRQARIFEKQCPKKGDSFQCPICQRCSIVGITAKVVADHDHHTGNIRDFICDSCNTGLGRFKNGKNYLHNAIAYLEERDKLNS